VCRLAYAIVLSTLIAAGGSARAESGQSPRARRGAALYEKYCQPCHGVDLKGYSADNAPSLISPTFRESADTTFLRSAIERGRAGTAMGGYGKRFGGPLGVVEVDSLIAFIRADTKPLPQALRNSTGDGAKGEQVYRKHCETCHGTPEQRANAVHLANPMFLETASDAFLRIAIVRGRPGTRMEAWGGKLAATEIEDVVAYLRSLARPVPPPPAPGESELLPIEGPIVIHPDGEPADLTLRNDRLVSIEELARAYSHRRRLVIIDARPPSDYMRLHISGAISIPHFNMRDLDKVPNDGTWVIAYCACPHHLSGIVFDELRKRGYKHSAVLDEGVFAWQRKGHPTVAAPGQLPIPAPPVDPAVRAPGSP
jgi:cytochrome c oxidase cbb3-type subunit 3/ubiquinol-cytochrome c reductase cytochrome c subunit